MNTKLLSQFKRNVSLLAKQLDLGVVSTIGIMPDTFRLFDPVSGGYICITQSHDHEYVLVQSCGSFPAHARDNSVKAMKVKVSRHLKGIRQRAASLAEADVLNQLTDAAFGAMTKVLKAAVRKFDNKAFAVAPFGDTVRFSNAQGYFHLLRVSTIAALPKPRCGYDHVSVTPEATKRRHYFVYHFAYEIKRPCLKISGEFETCSVVNVLTTIRDLFNLN